jgi:hypothetical protein
MESRGLRVSSFALSIAPPNPPLAGGANDGVPLGSDVAGWSGRVEVIVTFETVLGLLAAFFIGFFPPVTLGIATLAMLVQQRFGLSLMTGALLLISGRLAILIAKLAAHASLGRWDLAGQHDPTLPVVQLPFALAMACQLPGWPWVLRVGVGLWWLSHFCGAAVFGHAIGHSLIRRLDVATAVVAIPLAIVVHFSFLFAANLYLVLAARALAPHPRWCIGVWKYRFAIDFLIALALAGWQAGK